ncbi:MAG: hypothetical protein HY820_03600 [Acidobacteria bacterium]|nr:hypothetical protein [Acidobacteriota bacterium]
MRQGLPPHIGEVGDYPAGVALPIDRARLRIGGREVSRTVDENDSAATFRLRLAQGRTELKTWFYDGEGAELCGSYYVIVRRL